jgi:hypothetical protein
MSDQVLALLVIVVCVTGSVWAVALASQAVDLGILPVRRRHRVEWCRVHDRQVRVVGAGLVAVLALYQLVSAG